MLPKERTRENETFAKRFVDLLLKLNEFMRRHLVGSFGYRSGAWFQVDDEFDSSSRGNPWKFFREDVEEITHDGNVFNALEWCSVQRIQGIKSRLGVLN